MTPLAIIPARGGSERVPRKALRLLGDRPLIAWTIETARAAGCEPLVVTDDVEIAEAADCNAMKTHRMHSLHGMGGYLALVVRDVSSGPLPPALVLNPTHPFRRPDTLRALLNAPGPAVGVRKSRDVHRSKLDDGVFTREGPRERTQDLGVYTEAGGCWKLGPGFELPRSLYAVPVSAVEALDLDTEDDWTIASALVRAGVV